MRWGLIPSWSKDSSAAASMINARAETAGTKPAFRDALKSRRCLIPADGFYEWVRTGKAKQPFCFEVNGGELFAFAGLWDRCKDPSGNWMKTCSILTTVPNAVTSAVHDRMPVLLEPHQIDPWMNGTAGSEVLKPAPNDVLRTWPVSLRVNKSTTAGDDPTLIDEVALDAA